MHQGYSLFVSSLKDNIPVYAFQYRACALLDGKKINRNKMSDQAQVALLLCDKHVDEEMDIYCKTCKRPTCTECLKTSEHQGHDLDTIPKLYRKIKNRRLDLLKEMETKVNLVRNKNRRHLRNVQCRNEQLLKRNLENAEKKRTELHRAVDEIIDSHVNCLTEHSKKLGEEIDREVDKLQKDESELMKMLETFEKTTMVGLDLIEYYEKLREKVDSLQLLDISQYSSTQIYVEGELDPDSLQKMIGEVTEIKSGTNSVEIISSFQIGNDAILTICPLSDKEAWLSDTGEFRSIRRDGHHTKTVKHKTPGRSFIPHDGGFLVCNSPQKNILKVDMSGKSSVWMDTSPLKACTIGEALNVNVLITLCDEWSDTRTEQSQRSVRMVTPSGEVLHSYEYGEDGGTSVLTQPLFAMQNNNSDVCVINHFTKLNNKIRANLCVFYEDGTLKFVYAGQNVVPCGICCDLLCNIICVNYMDDTIHVISSEGSFLRYLFTSDTCVPYPFSIALQRGVLWVGSKKGEVRVYRYNH